MWVKNSLIENAYSDLFHRKRLLMNNVVSEVHISQQSVTMFIVI